MKAEDIIAKKSKAYNQTKFHLQVNDKAKLRQALNRFDTYVHCPSVPDPLQPGDYILVLEATKCHYESLK